MYLKCGSRKTGTITACFVIVLLFILAVSADQGNSQNQTNETILNNTSNTSLGTGSLNSMR